MYRPHASILVLAGLVGCSDYDIVGNPDPNDLGDSDDTVVVDSDEQQPTNVGTDFLAVTTANPLLPPGFANDFAVVVTNPDEDVDANVTIRLGGTVVAEVVVAPGEATTVDLPMIAELQLASTASVVKQKGAYEITSDVPIAAYQFSPLHYQASNGEFSYTNDASMLLPERVLTARYMVAAFPSFDVMPGFAAIVATEDGTEVTIHATARTAAGAIPALSPGQDGTITLDRGDVFQLLSAPSASADLTGSTIDASAPIAVFGGHSCTNVPLANPSCDHLEEMLQPVETWGSEFVMTAVVHPDTGRPTESVYHVLALHSGTEITFSPSSVHAPITLSGGDFLPVSTSQDFVVEASDKIAVYQYMESCSALGTDYGSLDGDPSMGSGVPMSQARASYVFLVPDTYQQNWVNVVAEVGSDVELDGSPVPAGREIASSGYWAARVSLGAGSHHLESTDGTHIAVTVYGYADYTSYLYPGGMNFVQSGD
jgi:hypothetical protein